LGTAALNALMKGISRTELTVVDAQILNASNASPTFALNVKRGSFWLLTIPVISLKTLISAMMGHTSKVMK